MIEALKNGDFYSTNGPEIRSLVLDDEGFVHMECTEIMQASILSHHNFMQMQPPYGEKSPVTQVKFDINRWLNSITDQDRDRAFIRFVLTDAAGKKAYTRAYWYKELV